MGRKLGAGGAGSPSNMMWPGPRRTCMPSVITIHPTVWPQCTNVTDRQTGQDRQTDRQTERTTVSKHRANRFTNGRAKIGTASSRFVQGILALTPTDHFQNLLNSSLLHN